MSCPEYESFAEFYDHVVPYRSRIDVAFFVDMARASGGPVLEVGCGTGRVLLPCARAGVDVVGLDVARPMLDVLRRSLARESADVQRRVRIVHDDMRTFALGQRFPLVTLPFRSFQHMLTRVLTNGTRKAPQLVQNVSQQVDVRSAGYGQEVQYLSGGNQQKVVLAKWLAEQHIKGF